MFTNNYFGYLGTNLIILGRQRQTQMAANYNQWYQNTAHEFQPLTTM